MRAPLPHAALLIFVLVGLLAMPGTAAAAHIPQPPDQNVWIAADETGRTVTYGIVGFSSTGMPAVATCAPASGTKFPVGTTVVACSANTFRIETSCTTIIFEGLPIQQCFQLPVMENATASFQVHVTRDVVAPTLVGTPANITVAATDSAGAAVTFPAPTATDGQSGVDSVSCSKASGDVFPIGSTTVTCTATDKVGLMSISTFAVAVDAAPGSSNTSGGGTPGPNGGAGGKPGPANGSDPDPVTRTQVASALGSLAVPRVGCRARAVAARHRYLVTGRMTWVLVAVLPGRRGTKAVGALSRSMAAGTWTTSIPITGSGQQLLRATPTARLQLKTTFVPDGDSAIRSTRTIKRAACG